MNWYCVVLVTSRAMDLHLTNSAISEPTDMLLNLLLLFFSEQSALYNLHCFALHA